VSDRLDRRRIVLAADGFHALLLAGLTLLLVTGTVTEGARYRAAS
jgi:hypothetical protein